MSFIDERLRAADPVAGRAYLHPSLDNVIDKITAPQPEVRNQWGAFKLRMGSAVGAASLLTVGAIALIQGVVPGLQVLSLATTLSAGPTAFASANTVGVMRIAENFDFIASPGLASTAPSSPAYELSTPTNGADELSRLAGIFGVTGPVASQGNGSWLVTGSDGSTLSYQSNGGLGTWSYEATGNSSVTSVTSQGRSSQAPSDATVEAVAQHVVGQLGYDYSIATPTFSSDTITTTSNSGTNSTVNEAAANYVVVVNGIATDQSAVFAVDQNGELISASGPAFRVSAPVSYPLQSPAQAVATLNEQQSQHASSDSGVSGSVGSGDSSGASSAPTSSTQVAPPTLEVTVTGSDLTLAAYQLSDGTAWLVPTYSLTGEITSADGSTSSGEWSQVAVTPAYIHLDSGVSRGVINY